MLFREIQPFQRSLTQISVHIYTILCAAHNYPLSLIIAAAVILTQKRGLTIAWSNPLLHTWRLPLRRHLLHDPAVDRLALCEEFVFVIRPRPQPLDIHLH